MSYCNFLAIQEFSIISIALNFVYLLNFMASMYFKFPYFFEADNYNGLINLCFLHVIYFIKYCTSHYYVELTPTSLPTISTGGLGLYFGSCSDLR